MFSSDIIGDVVGFNALILVVKEGFPQAVVKGGHASI